jgi:hypothetical protein
MIEYWCFSGLEKRQERILLSILALGHRMHSKYNNLKVHSTSSNHNASLRQNRRRITLIRGNNLTPLKLLIRIRRPNNLTRLLINNRHCRKPSVRAKLATPGRGNRVDAAGRWSAMSLRGGGALDDVRAICSRSFPFGTCGDAKGPGAFCIAVVADALEGGDGPRGVCDHH